MTTYRTSEIAKQAGLHPNTIRFYEEIGFLTKPVRLPNGYRVYTELHLEQVRLIRLAMRAEVQQNGLRKCAVDILRLCAACHWSKAVKETQRYLSQIDREIVYAKGAAVSVEAMLAHAPAASSSFLKRNEAAQSLGITVDTLRNWERNGLIGVCRVQNGFRVYAPQDMERLIIIRTLRNANYSLSAILRLTEKLAHSRNIPVGDVLNTPAESEEIVSVCDHLLTALLSAREDAKEILSSIKHMRKTATLQ